MPLTLRVVSLNGAAPPLPIEATFGEAGGSIGRAEDNDLVLPDTQRLVSRLHARVACEAGTFELIDQGSNPVEVNGAAMGSGRTVRLADGDRIRIGGYAIAVALEPTTVLAPAPAPAVAARGGAAPAAMPAAAAAGASAIASAAAARRAGGDAPAAPSCDPYAAPGLASSFADLLGPAPGAGGAAPAARAPHGGGIPDDFDPFADPFAVRPAEQAAAQRLPDDLDFGLGPGSAAARIDELFELRPASDADPFAGTPLSDDFGVPSRAARWRRSVSRRGPDACTRGACAGTRSRHCHPGRLLHRPACTPRRRLRRARKLRRGRHQPATRSRRAPCRAKCSCPWEEPAATPPARSPASPASPTGDALLDLFDGGDAAADPLGLAATGRGCARAAAPAAVPAAAGSCSAAPVPIPAPSCPAFAAAPAPPAPALAREPAPAPGAPAAVSAAGPAAAAPAQGGDAAAAAAGHPEALAQAFLKGLGDAAPAGVDLSPETMERIGRLLREATQGTLELLMARALTKREVRAEATMIVGRDNNPLKFSPDAEAALAHLLAPPRSASWPPAPRCATPTTTCARTSSASWPACAPRSRACSSASTRRSSKAG